MTKAVPCRVVKTVLLRPFKIKHASNSAVDFAEKAEEMPAPELQKGGKSEQLPYGMVFDVLA